MNDELLLDAMDHLDEDIVGDYVKLKLRFQDRGARKKSALIGKISLIAAAFVLAFAAVIMWQSGIFYSAEAVAPDMSKVVWGKEIKPPYVTNMALPHKDKNGFIVTNEVSNAFLNSTDAETVFAVWVVLKKERADSIEKASRYFQRTGVYCEVKNNRIFIFVTEEQFGNMRLNFIQKNNYVFDLARKSDFDQIVITNDDTENSYNFESDNDVIDDDYNKAVESTYSNLYNKVHINLNEDYSTIDDEEELSAALEYLMKFREEYVLNDERIWVTIQFHSEFGKTQEYIEYSNKKSNRVSREEGRELKKELYDFSFQYHKEITDKGADMLSFIDYDEIIAYDYSPFLLMKVYDISFECLLQMIDMEEIINISIGYELI